MIECFGLLVVMWCNEPSVRAPAVHCPPLVAYDPAAQSAAAAELRRLPPGSPARRLVADYATLRERCRAIEAPAR